MVIDSKDTSPESDPSDEPGDFQHVSSMFLELRQASKAIVAIRVLPEYAETLWHHLKFWDPTIRPLSKVIREATEYRIHPNGTPYLAGDWKSVEIMTCGKLDVVTRRLTPFFMAVSEEILRRTL
jgi:hypothetical protein